MKRSLNLIPLAARRRMAARRVFRLWSNAVGTAGLVCGVLLALEWGRGLSAVERLRSLDTQYAPLAKLTGELAQLTAQIDQLRAREEISLSLSQATSGLTLLGAVSHAAEEVDGRVYVTRFEFLDAGEGTGVRSSSSDPSAVRPTLKLLGAGIDGLVIAAFVEHLRDSGAFSLVSIAATRPLAGGAPAVREFEIECIL
ncbi:MAG: hypothetical protein ACRCT8_15950 [Lacipirellulaceae bacterium]